MLNTSDDQRKLLPNFEQLFATTAQAPGGVARLRELILTLAVQGKLVAQDANDEPASERLKKIRVEKDRLIAEGKIKKDKPLAEIAEEEKPFELPLGWEWGRLGELTNYGSPSKAKEIKPETWVLDMEDVEKNTGRVLEKIRFKDRESLSEKNSFEKSDVIYGKLRPYLNKVLVADEDGVCTTEFVPISSFGFIDSNYLKLSLSNPIFMDYVESKLYGMKMPRLGTTDARNAVVSIPPLAEQSRIVARVEELMRLCDALEEKGRLDHTQHQQLLQAMLDSLTQTSSAQELARNWQRLAQHFDLLIDRPEAVDALEQTILQLAVRGLLVEQDANDEPADELLKRIRSEKDQLIAEGKIKKDKPLPAISDEEQSFDLPLGWYFSRLEDISLNVVDCPHSTPKFIDDGYLCLDTNSFKKGVLLPHKLRYVSKETFLERNVRLEPKAGDLVFAREGSVGESILIPIGVDVCLGQRVMLFRFSESVSNEFVQLAISSASFLDGLLELHKGIGAKHVNVGDMRKAVIPLPPLAEQSSIVARVTELRALCQQLRDKLTQARHTQTLLAQAWVEQAAA